LDFDHVESLLSVDRECSACPPDDPDSAIDADFYGYLLAGINSDVVFPPKPAATIAAARVRPKATTVTSGCGSS
jgi:hypothetical protein